jgi:hypothetical protein
MARRGKTQNLDDITLIDPGQPSATGTRMIWPYS